MGIINSIQNSLTATAKAVRDCKFAEEFMEVHDQDPDREIAKKFFLSLGEDVTPAEFKRYRKLRIKWVDQWIAKHPAANRTFRFPSEEPPSVQVIPVNLGDLNPTSGFIKALRDAMIDAMIEQEPEAREAFEQYKRDNLAAGKCLACGGGIDAEGLCDGTPPVSGNEDGN